MSPGKQVSKQGNKQACENRAVSSKRASNAGKRTSTRASGLDLVFFRSMTGKRTFSERHAIKINKTKKKNTTKHETTKPFIYKMEQKLQNSSVNFVLCQRLQFPMAIGWN